jgi:hypothetical protein
MQQYERRTDRAESINLHSLLPVNMCVRKRVKMSLQNSSVFFGSLRRTRSNIAPIMSRT